MGKVVKYCSSCDEGFAERFGFCPTCGTTLEAYEMNPVGNDKKIPAAATPAVAAAAETLYASETPEFTAPEVQADTFNGNGADVSEPAVESVVPDTVAIPAAENVYVKQPMYADDVRPMTVTPEALDGGYYITVIEEKNSKQRNMLLLGSAAFCL